MKLFKDDFNTAQVTATPYGIGEDLQSVYGETYGNIMGEALVQMLSHSTLDYFPQSWEGLISALYYLNARIEAARKTITIWDAYQIRGYIQDQDQLLSLLAEMPENSSLVNNIELPFKWEINSKEYLLRKGDVLLKDNEGNIIYIPSLSSGYYAPMTFEQEGAGSNNYILKYHYFTDAPSTEPWQEGDTEPHLEHTFELNFTGESSGYNLSGVLGPGESLNIDYISFTEDGATKHLEPVVKYYTQEGELVGRDVQYNVQSVFSDIKDIDIKYLLEATNSADFPYLLPASVVSKTSGNNYFTINNLILSRVIGKTSKLASSDISTTVNGLTVEISGINVKFTHSGLVGLTAAQCVTWAHNLTGVISFTRRYGSTTSGSFFTITNTTDIPLIYEVK